MPPLSGLLFFRQVLKFNLTHFPLTTEIVE
jgi:hypothetical protein